MNTVVSKTSKRKAQKQVVEVAISFAMCDKQVAYGIRLSQGERSKVITGITDKAPMKSALLAIKGALLKPENVHLNIKHNSSKFHHWMYHTPNAFQMVKALLGATVFCNLGTQDDELIKQALEAVKPAEQPKKARKSRSKKIETALVAA